MNIKVKSEPQVEEMNMSLIYEVRHGTHPDDAALYDTDRIRSEYLIEDIFVTDQLKMVYSHIDRHIIGGAYPVTEELSLQYVPALKCDYFLERRELGIINIGGTGKVVVDEKEYVIERYEAIYIGSGNREIRFSSLSNNEPAKFYFNSATAHKSYPTKVIAKNDAKVLEMGSQETSNHRFIHQLIIKEVVDTCQLQMGLTELQTGSVWNTMPAHQHDRRMEAYFYFKVPKEQAVCHFMGEPHRTRNIWVTNEQAVISPSWSIHSGAGTSNYAFIWGMSGENLDYHDMDKYAPDELK